MWTAYEVGFMWAYANDLVPFYLDPSAHPVLFVLGFVAIPFFTRPTFSSSIACFTGIRSTASPTPCTTATTTSDPGLGSRCIRSSTSST